MKIFNPEKIISILMRNSKIIFLFILSGFISGIFYSVFIFKPVYNSSAKLLLSDSDKNLFATQKQIIRSNDFSKKVWNAINDKYKLNYEEKEGINKIKKAINLSNYPNTGIIELTASWSEPEIAHSIALAAITTYKELKTDLKKEKFVKNLEIIDKKLEQAEKELLIVKNKIIESQINRVEKQTTNEDFLKNQFVFANYLLQEKNLEGIVKILKTKQVEAEIQEAGSTSDIAILESPLIPNNCAFPGRLPLIFMFVWFFKILAAGFIIIAEFSKDGYDNIEELEKELNAPALGVIPWLDRELYDEPDIMFAIEETASFYSLAYQKIVSAMRIKGYNSDKNAIAFTSSGFSKFRSTIIMNLAYSLSRTGQSVVVVDADFRTPSIAKEMGFEISHEYSLAELLMNIAKNIHETGNFDSEKINMYTRIVPGTENFFIIPNSGNVPDPCEFLYSDAFSGLIKKLKKKYDWVFVDVPPAMAVPDAFMVSLYVDGIILLTGLEAGKSALRKIRKQFEDYNVNVFGVIAREFQTKEAISANEYIKQIIAQMMPQNEKILQ
ncbi:MAG TPA: AAA family ATPase [Candidatus Gastranaerophilales bacterium]|nr:AAA family ATPase [Candidatus Gastranaerophilales bacterium]